uniref:Putative secreted protein n=1 Tax=Ixodes ricinus TaxID=34613 RepID=A0A0K8R396_IXORI
MRLQLFMLTVGAGAIFCVAGGVDRGIQNSVETTTFDLTDDELEAIVQGLGQCTYRYVNYDGRRATIGCMATCGQTATSVQARHDSDDSEKITLELSDKLCILVTGNTTCENGTVILEGYLGNCTDGLCNADKTGSPITILSSIETESVAESGEEDE